MLIYPEDVKENNFCVESYRWFLKKYNGGPVEFETLREDLIALGDSVDWIRWVHESKIIENFEYLSKRATTSEPLEQFFFGDGPELYSTVEEAKTERELFVENLIHGIDVRFNVAGYKLVSGDAYEILDVDRSKEYPEADYYRVVDRNAQEYIVYSQEEAEELIENLNQRDFDEVYENFPIRQNYLFDGKYKASTPVE